MVFPHHPADGRFITLLMDVVFAHHPADGWYLRITLLMVGSSPR
jgi:hypothetical protein